MQRHSWLLPRMWFQPRRIVLWSVIILAFPNNVFYISIHILLTIAFILVIVTRPIWSSLTNSFYRVWRIITQLPQKMHPSCYVNLLLWNPAGSSKFSPVTIVITKLNKIWLFFVCSASIAWCRVKLFFL